MGIPVIGCRTAGFDARAGDNGLVRTPESTRRWRRGGLRERLTTLAALAVAGPLLLGIVVFAGLLYRSLAGSLATEALQHATSIASSIASQGDSRITARSVDLDDGFHVAVYEGTRLVYQDVANSPAGDPTTQFGDVIRPGTAPASGHGVTAGVRAWWWPGDVDAPVAGAMATRVGGTLVTVVVTTSQAKQHEAVSTTAKLLLVGLPLLVGLAGLATWLLVGRTLRPVEAIRARVEAIGSGQLDARVPVPPTGDEVARLATTMNGMLGRLERSSEAQRRFVADAGHELRSPLATISAGLDLAHADGGAIDPELADLMRREASRMTRLVDDLLQISRIDDDRLGLRRRDVDLDDLAEAEVRRLRHEGVPVQARIEPVRIVGDELKLSQVIRNLATNAQRHAGDRVAITVTHDDGVAEVIVDDDGAGVPVSDRSRIFERFVRLDDSRTRESGGFGLGLPIVRGIVEGHGGTVQAQESPWGGARFVVRLPLTTPGGGQDVPGASSTSR